MLVVAVFVVYFLFIDHVYCLYCGKMFGVQFVVYEHPGLIAGAESFLAISLGFFNCLH